MSVLSTRPRRCARWGAILLAAVVLTARPSPGQITTNTALPVARGQGIVRLQAKFLRSTGDATAADRDVRVLAFPVVGVYGITARLAAFGVFPILDKSLDVTTPLGRITRSTTGLGDVRLFARYTAFQFNRRGLLIRLAPFAGLELPTGSNNRTDRMGRLPRALQAGSGSWDPFVGVVLTRQSFAWQIDLSAAYQFNTSSDAFAFGDEARLDVAAKVRLLPRNLGRGLPHFLYANLETNLIRQSRNTIGNGSDANSGGTTWYAAPGLQYVTRRLILEAAVQFPVVQDLNGTALENNLITTLSARFSF